MHVQLALDTIKQKGLEAAMEKSAKDEEECAQKLQRAQEVFANYKGRMKILPNRGRYKMPLPL